VNSNIIPYSYLTHTLLILILSLLLTTRAISQSMPPKPCTDNEKSCKHKQISNSDARCDYFLCSQRVDGVEVKGKVAGLIGSENLRRMHACATDAKATANILMCGGGMEVTFC
jgi:hypothetical protein